MQGLAEIEQAAGATIAPTAAIFGKYLLLKRLAVGGMGEILLAKVRGRTGFDEPLVIKRILEHHAESERFVEMFLDEARVAARLSHPNIVHVYEMGQTDGRYYLAMEYVHGRSLRDIINKARLRGEYPHPAHVIEMVSAVCAGLAYAHAAPDLSGEALGIVHRDVNPQNLLVDYDGTVKLIDFGVARAATLQQQTDVGAVKGKLAYMSPEQLAGQPLDARSDLFAAGICLYECLALRNPFARGDLMQSLEAIRTSDPPAVTEVNRALAPLAPIIAKALAKRREDRYRDCGELRGDLQELLTSGAVARAPQSLAAYMQDLFEMEIAEDRRWRLDLESATETQLVEHWEAQASERISPVLALPASSSPDDAARELSHAGRRATRRWHRAVAVLVGVGLFAALGIVARTQLRATTRRPAATAARSRVPPVLAAPVDIDTPSATPEASTGLERGVRAPVHRRPTGVRPTTLGSLLLSTDPPAAITLDGKVVGPTVDLTAPRGRLIVRAQANEGSDAWVVTLSYRVTASAASVDVDAEPSAFVRDGRSRGLGRTPVRLRDIEDVVTLDLSNPDTGGRLKLSVRHTR
ncbi:MAG: serine/threonine-protein kinase [Myxococcota bacterium]